MNKLTYRLWIFSILLQLFYAKFSYAEDLMPGKAIVVEEDVESIDLAPLEAKTRQELNGLSPSEQLTRISEDQSMIKAALKRSPKFLEDKRNRLLGFQEILRDFPSSKIEDLRAASKIRAQNESLLKEISKIEQRQARSELAAQEKADKKAEKERKALEKSKATEVKAKAKTPRKMLAADTRKPAQRVMDDLAASKSKIFPNLGSNRSHSSSVEEDSEAETGDEEAKNLLGE